MLLMLVSHPVYPGNHRTSFCAVFLNKLALASLNSSPMHTQMVLREYATGTRSSARQKSHNSVQAAVSYKVLLFSCLSPGCLLADRNSELIRTVQRKTGHTAPVALVQQTSATYTFCIFTYVALLR